MISDERKLFIMIGATAFRTSNKELLEKYATNFVSGLSEEEIQFGMSLFKGDTLEEKKEHIDRSKLGGK